MEETEMKLSPDEVLQHYRDTGALLSGHFILSSGKRSDTYLQSAIVCSFPDVTRKLAESIAEDYRDEGIEVVVGPAMGGIIIAYEVARALGCRAIFSERENGEMQLRRGFTLLEGERVLIVEDVVTTGKSALEVATFVRGRKADIRGFASIIFRADEVPFKDIRYTYLAHVSPLTWNPEDEPPEHVRHLPAVKPGSRDMKK
ncbi:MAG: orotate phosphoribosyltransferase [Planctomycetes bacterium]|nr:orotate phosphoribosyltransferase [Planctomycetota bacterium]